MTKLSHRAWGLDTLPDGEWLQYAQCKPDDAPLFDVFGHKGIGEQTLTEQNQQAVNICRRCPAEPAPEPDTEPADFADAVADLLGLGWSVGRVAEALGIGVTAVRQHAQQQAVA